MASDPSLRRYREWYRRLVSLYPRPYRERFGEAMQQTFGDLLNERVATGTSSTGFAFVAFTDTLRAVIKENLTYISMNTITTSLVRWAIVVACILVIPLVMTIHDGGVEGVGWNWTASDFIFMGALLFGAGVVYQILVRKLFVNANRVMVGLAVTFCVLVIWVELATGGLSRMVEQFFLN